MPGTFYAVKIDDDSIKIAETAEKALKTVPEVVDITSVGIGTSHRFNAVNQNAKLMVSIDNVIQSRGHGIFGILFLSLLAKKINVRIARYQTGT